MRTVTLDENLRVRWIYVLPAGGWLLSTFGISKSGNEVTEKPIVVQPDGSIFVHHRKAYITKIDLEDRRIMCLSPVKTILPEGVNRYDYRDSQKRVYDAIGEDGRIADNYSQAIEYLSFAGSKDYYVSCYSPIAGKDKEWTKQNAAQIAAGLIDGGIIIVRKKDKASICLSIDVNENSNAALSQDGLTILCYNKNVLTIVDNPLI